MLAWKRNIALAALFNVARCNNNSGISAFVSSIAVKRTTLATTSRSMVVGTPPIDTPSRLTPEPSDFAPSASEVTADNPLRVLIAGAGVGGLALANSLVKNPNMRVTVLERTDAFKRFGGPIQLASNALQVLRDMDEELFQEIMKKFTYTGDKMNGIKDGIRNEWYAKFDLKSPAEARNMPFTGVIDRPDLQDIYLSKLEEGIVQNGDAVVRYETNPKGHGVKVFLESGKVVEGDVLIGADGIWSAVRATMRDEPLRGDGSGVAYSGYTVFAGELKYDSFDNGEVGYKVYIGPGQYFVITDIGHDMYQWYAFLARPPGSAKKEERPEGNVKYLKNIFLGWSKDVHHILDATQENEIDQRDLYDRPPSIMKPWTKGCVALIGDSVHAMMPNLGQGGCQAIEDAHVIVQELSTIKSRNEIEGKLKSYKSRRLIRSAAVQGLSRFASDIIIRGFDTPAKIINKKGEGIKFENFNYAGVVTKMMQPILPVFFIIQFNYLYEGWRNERGLDLVAGFGFLTVGGLLLLLSAGSLGGVSGLGLGFGLDAFAGGESLDSVVNSAQNLF